MGQSAAGCVGVDRCASTKAGGVQVCEVPKAVASCARADFCSRGASVDAQEGANTDDDSLDPSDAPSQEHIFKFDGDLDTPGRAWLYEQFDSLTPPPAVTEAFKEALKPRGLDQANFDYIKPCTLFWERFKHPPEIRNGASATYARMERDWITARWRRLGLEEIRRGVVGVVLCVGSEDSLSKHACDGIVATSDLGLLSRKSILQLYFERLLRLKHLAARSQISIAEVMDMDKINPSLTTIKVYIVTGDGVARAKSEAFLEANNFFGYPAGDVRFVTQDPMPLLDMRGRYLLESKGHVHLKSVGAGGAIAALVEDGVVSEMTEHSIESVYICCADNLLTKVADPTLVGHAYFARADLVVAAVERDDREPEPHNLLCTRRPRFSRGATKRAGVGPTADSNKVKKNPFGLLEAKVVGGDDDARTYLMEASCVLADSRLRENDCNSQHVFHVAPLPQFVCSRRLLAATLYQTVGGRPWRAVKERLSALSMATGESQSHSALRLELRLGDFACLAPYCLALVQERSEHLAIVNAPHGLYSPQSACFRLAREHRRWLLAAGAHFYQTSTIDEQGALACEVSPLVSYDGEGLAAVHTSRALSLPLYISSVGNEWSSSMLAHALDIEAEVLASRVVDSADGIERELSSKVKGVKVPAMLLQGAGGCSRSDLDTVADQIPGSPYHRQKLWRKLSSKSVKLKSPNLTPRDLQASEDAVRGESARQPRTSSTNGSIVRTSSTNSSGSSSTSSRSKVATDSSSGGGASNIAVDCKKGENSIAVDDSGRDGSCSSSSMAAQSKVDAQRDSIVASYSMALPSNDDTASAEGRGDVVAASRTLSLPSTASLFADPATASEAVEDSEAGEEAFRDALEEAEKCLEVLSHMQAGTFAKWREDQERRDDQAEDESDTEKEVEAEQNTDSNSEDGRPRRKVKKFIFSEKGPLHVVYTQARGLRCRREKVFGHAFTKKLQGLPPEDWRDRERHRVVPQLYKLIGAEDTKGPHFADWKYRITFPETEAQLARQGVAVAFDGGERIVRLAPAQKKS